MALGTPQHVTDAGVTPSYATPAASDSFDWPSGNPPYVLMHVKNANASECNIAIASEAHPGDGAAATDKAVVVPATTGDKIVRVSQAFRAADDTVAITFDVQTSVSVALLYE